MGVSIGIVVAPPSLGAALPHAARDGAQPQRRERVVKEMSEDEARRAPEGGAGERLGIPYVE